MNERFLKFVFLFVLFVFISHCSHQQVACRTDWKITGFYTPIASNYSTNLNKTIEIKSFKSVNFNRNFLKAVQLEGWGKTRFGWYLGYYSDQWHRESSPLNALGHPLTIGAIAVDNNIITKNSHVNIPLIQNILGVNYFKAVDVGSAIKNKHIDIYTGEGEKARKLSYKVTGKHQVCF